MAIFVRRKTGLGPDIKLWFLGIYWRGWKLSPLFNIGRKCTIHFHSGIGFGYWNSIWDTTYYIGYMILSIDRRTKRDDRKCVIRVKTLKYARG